MVYTTMTLVKSGVDEIKKGIDSKCLVTLIDTREWILLNEDDNKHIEVECYRILDSSGLLLIGDFGNERLLAVTSYSERLSREMLEKIVFRMEYCPLKNHLPFNKQKELMINAEDLYDHLYAR